jgi:hypothetical protein
MGTIKKVNDLHTKLPHGKFKVLRNNFSGKKVSLRLRIYVRGRWDGDNSVFFLGGYRVPSRRLQESLVRKDACHNPSDSTGAPAR